MKQASDFELTENLERLKWQLKHSRLKRLGSSNARRSDQFNLVSLAGTHFFEGKSILHA
jgi:hypothetical protein